MKRRRITRIPRNTWHPTGLPYWMPEHPDLPSLDEDGSFEEFDLGGPIQTDEQNINK